MRVRDWQDILEDVVESDADADGWRAVSGDRASGIGEDLYVGHPAQGVYQLKTYARNPFEVQGVGAEIARRVDEDIDPLFPTEPEGGMFGVQPPVEKDEAEQTATHLEEVFQTHAETPTTPDALFEDVMDVLDSPAYGPMEYDQHGRPDVMDDFTDTFEEAEELLDKEFEDVVDEDVERGFQ